MFIKKITKQCRRDFSCIYECEHCGHTEDGGGYDDINFHQNVVPVRKCGNCGKQGGSMPVRATKYPAGFVV